MCAIKRRNHNTYTSYYWQLPVAFPLSWISKRKKQNTAVSSLESAMNDLPLDASTRPGNSGCDNVPHNYASAEAVLVKAADQHPKVLQIYDYLGRIFFVDGKYLNAAIALKKSEALQPLEEKDRFTLAMAYISLHMPCAGSA